MEHEMAGCFIMEEKRISFPLLLPSQLFLYHDLPPAMMVGMDSGGSWLIQPQLGIVKRPAE